MKKIIAVLAVLIGLLLVAGFGFVLLFMEEPEDTMLVDNPNSQSQDGQPQLNVPKEVVTQADELEALDVYTQQNQDTVGWLRVPGTTINNSVLQSHDNMTYLRTNEAREYDIYGCYFADWECSVGERENFSPNTVIYGLSDLKDNPEGPRFSQLFRFTDPDFARETPVISFPPWTAALWSGRYSRSFIPKRPSPISTPAPRAGWISWPKRPRKNPCTTTGSQWAQGIRFSPCPPAPSSTAPRTTTTALWSWPASSPRERRPPKKHGSPLGNRRNKKLDP